MNLPKKIDRHGLGNYTTVAAELGVSQDQVRVWFKRNTAGIQDLALSALRPPVFVQSEVVARIREWRAGAAG